jgi:hypothetical protein
MCVLGLLMVFYVVGFVIELVINYWYLLAGVIATLAVLRVWWNQRHPIFLEDEDEGDEWEPVPQE